MSQILLILKSLEKQLLTKVVGGAVIFNPKKSLEKLLLTKVVGGAVILNPKKSLEKQLLIKVVGGAVIFNQKKSLEKQFLTKVVGKAVIFNPNKNRLCSNTCGVDKNPKLPGKNNLISKKMNDNFIERAGSHPKENSQNQSQVEIDC